MVFKGMRLDDSTQGISVNREEDQGLSPDSIPTYKEGKIREK